MAMREWGRIGNGTKFVCDCGHEEVFSEMPDVCPACGTPSSVPITQETAKAGAEPSLPGVELTDPLPEPVEGSSDDS